MKQLLILLLVASLGKREGRRADLKAHMTESYSKGEGEEGEDDELEDKEVSPPDHIADTPLEQPLKQG